MALAKLAILASKSALSSQIFGEALKSPSGFRPWCFGNSAGASWRYLRTGPWRHPPPPDRRAFRPSGFYCDRDIHALALRFHQILSAERRHPVARRTAPAPSNNVPAITIPRIIGHSPSPAHVFQTIPPTPQGDLRVIQKSNPRGLRFIPQPGGRCRGISKIMPALRLPDRNPDPLQPCAPACRCGRFYTRATAPR